MPQGGAQTILYVIKSLTWRKAEISVRWLNVVAENAEVHQYLRPLLFSNHTARQLLASLKGRSGHITEFWPSPDSFDQSCHFCLPFIGQRKFMSKLEFSRMKISSHPPRKGVKEWGIWGWSNEHFKKEHSLPH